MQSVTRLITKFIPESYNLSLVIEREARTFHGTLTMRGVSVDGEIIVHARDLTIESGLIDGKKATWCGGENDEIIFTRDGLSAGTHTLVIGYHGTITDTLHGLYPCKFEQDGVKKELIATQCESHYAREIFPCIDEPEAKATFDITVTTEQNVTVLGNMPVRSSEVENNHLVTTFETTPRMSTYLFALVAGELQSISRTTKDGIKTSIWSTPAHPKEQLEYALQSAIESLEFFNEYFGVPYPLPKADHVALPDFDAGAMENWGLITYRESALIVDKNDSSLPSRQYVSSVIAHELSHQWFGNLVTMKWWNNLWLNESFASIMEVIAPNAVHPEWNLWLDFSASDGVVSSRRDAIDGVQAVQTPVNHPDEINSIFDGAIVYAKGARLMCMCQQYIGEEAFRRGLHDYFVQHSYSNTEETDLWYALGNASGKNVGELMNTWISQSGFPVVNAHEEDGVVTLSQDRFFIGPHKSSDNTWPIPLDANDPNAPELLREKSTSFNLSSNDYLQLNQHDAAHFIVNYDNSLLAKLIDAVRAGKLSEVGRMKLLHERVMLARAGLVDPASLVDLLEAYQDESSDPVWDMMSLAIGELKKFIEHDDQAEQKLRALVGRLSRPQYERLGWSQKDGETVNDTKLRTLILANMVYAEDQSVIDQALQTVSSTPIDDLPPEQRSLLLSTALRYGNDASLAQHLFDRYCHEVSPNIKDDLRGALTSTRDHSTITMLLGELTNTAHIRTQDTTHWFIYLLSNRYARDATWKWVRNEWSWIEKTFGSDKSFDYYPRYAGQLLVTRQQLDEYRDFFARYQNDVALGRTIEMGLTDLEGRIALLEANESAVTNRLRQL